MMNTDLVEDNAHGMAAGVLVTSVQFLLLTGMDLYGSITLFVSYFARPKEVVAVIMERFSPGSLDRYTVVDRSFSFSHSV